MGKVAVTGKVIYGGIAIGTLFFYGKDENQVKRTKITNVEEETARFHRAKEKAVGELMQLYEKAEREVGQLNASIFETHAMMLEDDDYIESVESIIQTQMVNAEYATAVTGDRFSQMFANMEDEYFKARAVDVKDISERVISVLTERTQEGLGEPAIVIAEDLAPSETVQMDKSKLLGFVTRQGSSNSHTAILARTMNIPAVIHVDIQREWNGKLAILDGFTGTLIVEPSQEELDDYRERQRREEEKQLLLQTYKGRETINKHGKKIRLYANIGSVSDIGSVIENDAEGIGLFRSEFLYLQSSSYPSEEEQFQAYKSVLETMAGKRVIIRTLDIGADKQADYFQLDEEENPALGFRAIRICLKRPEVFKTQLRALYRASHYGTLSIMFPMITSVWEIQKIKEIVDEVKKELDELGILYGDVELGIMIETPAAVMISDLLAKEVDFFSIGTNDLLQYTLAVDRQNAQLDAFYDSHHEALLRMLRMTVENAHREQIWVGICGELGGDIALTDTFMEMGIDELSVSPSRLLAVRKAILAET